MKKNKNIIHSFDADFSNLIPTRDSNAVASCVHRPMAINDRNNVEIRMKKEEHSTAHSHWHSRCLLRMNRLCLPLINGPNSTQSHCVQLNVECVVLCVAVCAAAILKFQTDDYLVLAHSFGPSKYHLSIHVVYYCCCLVCFFYANSFPLFDSFFVVSLCSLLAACCLFVLFCSKSSLYTFSSNS